MHVLFQLRFLAKNSYVGKFPQYMKSETSVQVMFFLPACLILLSFRYNLLKESNGKATTGRRKWEFFQLMEELMTDSPIQTTKSLYRSSGNFFLIFGIY